MSEFSFRVFDAPDERDLPDISRVDVLTCDLDGFLIESLPKLAEYHEETFRQLKVQPPSFDRIVATISGDAKDVWHELWGDYPDEIVGRAKEIFQDLADTDPEPATPIDGVPEGIALLRAEGVALNIATFRRFQVNEAIASGGLSAEDFIQVYDGNSYQGSEFEVRKAEGIQRIQRLFGIAAVNHMVGGDRPSDMKAAKEASPDTTAIGVPSLGSTPEGLYYGGGDLVVPSFEDVVNVVLSSRA